MKKQAWGIAWNQRSSATTFTAAAVAQGHQIRKRKRLATAQVPAFRPPHGCLTRSDKHGFHMGVRVALDVAIRSRRGNQPVQRAFDVAGNIRVRTFIDGDRCRVWRHIQVAIPLPTPDEATAFCTCAVTSTSCVRRSVFTLSVFHLRASRQRADSSMRQIRKRGGGVFSLVGAQHAAPSLARPHRRAIPTAARTASSPRGFCAENLLSAPPIQGNTNSLCYAGPYGS